MMTIDEIRKECVDTFKKANVDFEKQNIRLSLNGRLSRTLGKCKFLRCGSKITVTDIEISRKFAEMSDAKTIVDVIRHECAHALAIILSGESHGHDSYFKQICHMIGTYNDGTCTDITGSLNDEDNFYKYIVYCPTCNKTLAKYHRISNVIKNIDNYKCKDCGSKIAYRQNF